MSYARRNSLLLGILLVLVLSAGFYWIQVRQKAAIGRLEKKQQEAQAELRNINAVLSIYDQARTQLEALKKRWQNREQVVPASDNPAVTLVYLQDLLAAADATVRYDFLFKGPKEGTGYRVNRYGVAGEAGFDDLYAFIRQLEYGRRFYSVDHLQLEYGNAAARPGSARWDWVDFKLVLSAYFEPGSRVEELPRSVRSARGGVQISNPFRPLVTQGLPSNRQGLFEVQGASLVGLSEGLAYLTDRQGRVHMLKEGDRVFMGRLSRIDIQNNRVVFELNKGGIRERHTLKVKVDAPER